MTVVEGALNVNADWLRRVGGAKEGGQKALADRPGLR